MRLRDRCACWVLGLLAAAAIWPLASMAFAVDVGQVIDDEEMPTLDGGRATLFGKKAMVNVFIFFRPGQERSADTLRQMAACERDLAGKPVHWVAVVSDSEPPDDVRALVRASGVRMPVLVDRGDTLYARLGVHLHPVIGIADRDHRLAAFQPYERINYCDIVKARIRFLMKEITQAELDRVLDPAVATMPGDEARAVGMRDVKLGRRQMEMKLYDKAVLSGRKALEREPTLAAAHTLIGQALAASGKCAEALSEFDQALKLDPGDAAAGAGKRGCGGR